MFRLFGILLIGLAVSILSTEKSWAEVIATPVNKSGGDWNSDPQRAAALLAQKLRGPIDLQCPHFAEYLENRVEFNAAKLAVVPQSVKDEAKTIEHCKERDARVARWESERLITEVWARMRQPASAWNSGNIYKPIVSEAFRLAKISCARGDGYGCGVAAFILKDYSRYIDDNPSSNAETTQTGASGFLNKKAKQYAIEGWSYDSVEAGGVLLDLSALNSAQASKSREDARAFLDEMLATNSVAAQIREASLCVDQGILGGLSADLEGIFGGGKDCSGDCALLLGVSRKQDLDIMSRSRAVQLLGMPKCANREYSDTEIASAVSQRAIPLSSVPTQPAPALASYLKGLEGNPKKHFEEAIKAFNKDSLLNGQIVGSALRLEMNLFVAEQFAVFAKSSADIMSLFQAVDWNSLDAQTIATAHDLIKTKYSNTPVFRDSAVIKNMNTLQFNKSWADALHKRNSKVSRKIINNYLIRGDCDAYNYTLERPNRGDLALITQETMVTCVRQMQNNSEILQAKKTPSKNTDVSGELAKERQKRIELEQQLATLKAQKEQQRQTILSDKQKPVIDIAGTAMNGPRGTITGNVRDNTGIAEVRVDGSLVEVDSSGNFKASTYVPKGGINVMIEAVDLAGLSAAMSIRLERLSVATTPTIQFERLNPLGRKVAVNKDALALIIGVDSYENTPARAIYADSDAKVFGDYASEKLGIPANRIKTLVNDTADEKGMLLAVKDWLSRATKRGKTDIYVFFAGHGLSSQDGEKMYLLPYDGSPRLLEKTAILRAELFDDIKASKPRSVTVFLDTCYSGATRSEEMLIAGRPIVIKANEQPIPENFTLLTAAAGDQIANPLEEAKHGMFSYFLMKGMEGEADANNDNEITAGELHSYVQANVIQQSSGSQTPELQGDADRVLVRFQ